MSRLYIKIIYTVAAARPKIRIWVARPRVVTGSQVHTTDADGFTQVSRIALIGPRLQAKTPINFVSPAPHAAQLLRQCAVTLSGEILTLTYNLNFILSINYNIIITNSVINNCHKFYLIK